MAGEDGLTYLVAVTQMKSNNANDQALHGAEDQRALVKQQELLRARQGKFEEMVRDNNLTDDEYWAIAKMLNDEGLSTNGTVDGSWNGILGYFDEGHSGEVHHWNAKIGGDASDDLTNKNQKKVEAVRSEFDGKMKSLEAQDRMGNFEIQRLMSAFNQAETLSSNMQKKTDDTISGVQQKIA
jgi:hypothetical protein